MTTERKNSPPYSEEIFPPSEDYYFEGHHRLPAVNRLWELTKPTSSNFSSLYRKSLFFVNSVPDKMFHYRPFYVEKPDGTKRLIFAACPEMRAVQKALTGWLDRSFPKSIDFCYRRGRGVEDAVGHHLEGKPRYGYVFDLRHAFLKITDKMLERELRLYLGEENTEVISAFADFTTVARRLREGTVCAPFGFNLIMKPFDNAMKILTKEKDLILSGEENDFELTFSRYADNCAFLSPRPLDFEKLKRQVQRFVKGH